MFGLVVANAWNGNDGGGAMRRSISPAVAGIAALSALDLGGCASSGPIFGRLGAGQDQATHQPAPAPEIPASIRPSEVVGRWGYAAYHRPEDPPRTEAAARGQCAN